MMMMNKCNINIHNPYAFSDQATSAINVANANNIETLQLLIKNGADINAVDHNKMAPFHIAACFGRLEALRFLYETGKVNINSSCVNGGTPSRYI